MRFLLIIALINYFTFIQDDGWDIKKLDTARDVNYLTDIEKDVILEMNKVRSDPVKYAEMYVLEIKELYDGKLLKYPGEIAILTDEGLSAVNECYRVLKRQKPVSLLYPSKGMSQAAMDHVKDQSKSGKLDHSGSDRSTPFDRMNRHGEWIYTAAENIDYGNNIARRIILSLLIDDGVASRGHRNNILNDKFGKTGVAIGNHPKYEHMCVITYAADYKEKYVVYNLP